MMHGLTNFQFLKRKVSTLVDDSIDSARKYHMNICLILKNI